MIFIYSIDVDNNFPISPLIIFIANIAINHFVLYRKWFVSNAMPWTKKIIE